MTTFHPASTSSVVGDREEPGVVVVDERSRLADAGAGQGAQLGIVDGGAARLVERPPGALDAEIARLATRSR